METEPQVADDAALLDQPDEIAQRQAQAEIYRRRFLLGAAAAAGGAFLYTWRIEPHWVEIVRRSLPVARLPDKLCGARVVQLSDLHAGPIVDQNFLLRGMERVAELRPDLIVLTGDYMTHRGQNSIPKALDVMRALPKPKLGRLAILGNHDYGYFFREQKVADHLSREFDKLDIRILRNEVAEVEGLQVAGVDDYYTHNFNPAKAIAALDLNRAAIALCHNPDGVDEPGWGPYRGWVLAGHTHGGQCKPPFMAPPMLPVHNRRYVAGEYDAGAGRRLYINRGLGYLYRVRFNCRPEITVFTLERAAAS